MHRRWRGGGDGGGSGIGVGGCRISRGSLLGGLLGAAGRVVSSPLFGRENGRGGIDPPWGDRVGGGDGDAGGMAVGVVVSLAVARAVARVVAVASGR